MTFDHVHGYVRMRVPGKFGALVMLVLMKLHLPTDWMIDSGTLPHHPDCTPTEAVLESDR